MSIPVGAETRFMTGSRRALLVVAIAGAMLGACGAPMEGNDAASAGGEGGAYPATAVLTAFRSACSDLGSIEAASGRVRQEGWTELASTSGTPIAPLMDFAQREGNRMVEQAGGTVDPMRSFRKTVAGEDLYLVVSQVRIEGNEVTGCRMYDVDDPRRISIADATAWLGRGPSQTEDRPELMRGLWTPGFSGGQDSFELFYIPAGSPALQLVQIAGIGLKIDQVRSLQ